MSNLKLFIWHDVLQDHTSGVMFAMAENVEQAKELIIEKILEEKGAGWVLDDAKKELKLTPEEVTLPKGFYLYGGG